ncbi:putative ga4 desaturase [Phaeomoniella chlamydospora]|uniref:Putative ga4 desaturase n=1 Tax=Phaeomoniella chlamydospora TaxID=158046 RepID=A0A0G2EF65_PHACM|nr:putative ga4 desaturase [Phaeomoniella chlamydospora]
MSTTATTTTTTTTVTTASPSTTTNTTIKSPSPSVPTHGKLRYIARGITPTASPHLYHLPPMSEFADVRTLPITDIKPSLDLGDATPYTLDTYGFTARRHPSKLHSPPYTRESWNDETLLKEIYFPEVEELIKKLTGATKVITESAIMRNEKHTEVDGLARSEDQKKTTTTSSSPEEIPASKEEDPDPFPKLIGTQPSAGASPAPKVHLDFSPLGARIHLAKYHHITRCHGSSVLSSYDALTQSGIPDSALRDHYTGSRWAMFSIWRPLRLRRLYPGGRDGTDIEQAAEDVDGGIGQTGTEYASDELLSGSWVGKA